MGDAQSAEERSGDARDDEQDTGDKPLINIGQVSEVSGKAESSIAEVNGLCEEQGRADAFLSAEKDDSGTEKPLKEEDVEISEKESLNEADEQEPLEVIEMDAKQNDINEGFRRFFSTIGLKLTVKSGSGDVASDDTDKEDPNRPEDIGETTKETTSENREEKTDLKMAQETYDNDSTTCPTLTDVSPEDAPQNAEEETPETKEEAESDYVDAEMPVEEDSQHEATPEEEPESPSGPEEAEVVSPMKRFFTTGIFSGLRKKKKLPEEETADKELEDLGKKEVVETAEQTEQDQHQDREDIRDDVEAAAVETELKELEGGKTPAAQIPDPLSVVVTEPDILSSQEKEKVPASPLKRLFPGSFNKLPRKQRSRRSSDARTSDSGEHVSEKVLSSTESDDYQKGEVSAHSSAEEEEGAWASFKKLMTPKKLRKRPSISNEETQIKCLAEDSKAGEGGQTSDHSTDEGNTRKDSSVSWESVLCGSGRRRSRKTSDSEEETPQNNNDKNKQDTGSKGGAESGLESSHEDSVSPSEADAGSTWKSLKRLVTPKRKSKDEDESKDGVQSDSESTQDESSFSIRKLLPGRKKGKSAEKPDQVSSDEADKDVASEDEDSETPAIVPLSEFDIVETAVQIETQADVERRTPKDADHEVQRGLLDQKAEPVLQGVCLQAQDKEDASESKAPSSPAASEDSDDTESLSKPQLSDIAEEATAASVTEDAARDDTIAEDLIEITSEAFTAPEPLDIAQEDETEMISAVSQLSSESSNTSGNTTPVPAEYVVKETDALLYQVVETILISPEEVPVCSDDVRSERLVVSVSHQIMDTIVKKGQTVLEIHKGLDATDSNPDLDVEELEAVDKLTASAQAESISEVKDSVSTEMVSEVHTEHFETADIALDDVHEVDVTHPEQSLKELESIDEIYQLGECLSAASTDTFPPGADMVLEEGSLAETEAPRNDPQVAAGTEAEGTRDEAMQQDVPSLTQKEYLTHNVTDLIQVEDTDEPPGEAQEKQALDPEEGRVQAPEEDIISEDTRAAETHAHEEESLALTEVNDEPEKEDEVETDAARPEHVQEQEASEALQPSLLVSEEGSDQSPTEEVQSEDLPEAEPVTDQLKQTEGRLAEVSVEPEEPKEDLLPLTEGNVEQVEASRTVEEASEVASLLPLEHEEIPGDISAVEAATEEPKAEIIPCTGDNLEPVDAPETNDETPEALEVAQAPTFEPPEVSVQLLENVIISEDVPEPQKVIHEANEETLPCTEANLEPAVPSTTQHVQEPAALDDVEAPASDSAEVSVQSLEVTSEDVSVAESEVEDTKTEHVLAPEKLETDPVEAVQAAILHSEAASLLPLEKEAISEDVAAVETVTDEPGKETIPCTEAHLEPGDSPKTKNEIPEVLEAPTEASIQPVDEDVQEAVVLPAVQVPTLDSEAGRLLPFEKEVISEDVSGETEEETIAGSEADAQPGDAPKTSEEPEVLPDIFGSEDGIETIPLNKDNTESMETEHDQDEEILQAVQASRSDSEVGIPVSLEQEVVSEEAEAVTEEPRDEAMTPLAVTSEPVEASKTGDIQEPEEVQAVEEATSDSDVGSIPPIEKEVASEDVREQKTISDEAKEETEPRTEADCEDTSNTAGQQDVLEAVETPASDSEVGSPQWFVKEVISEDIPVVETDKDEPKQDHGVEPEERLPEEAVQEPEVLPSDSEDIVTEIKADEGRPMDVKEVLEDVEGGNAQQEIFIEGVPKPDVDHVIASVTNGIESEVVAQPDTSLETAEDQNTEGIPQDVVVEQENCVPEVVDEIQTLTAVSVSLVIEDTSVQVPENTVLTDQLAALSEDTAKVTNEPNHAVQLGAVQATVETKKESELPGTETTNAFQHAVVAQVVVCKYASVAIPDVLEQKTSAIPEPSISEVAREQVFKDELETSTPLLKDEADEKVEGGGVAVMMHVPSVESEDDHRIQVQVVDVDVKSAETIQDSVLEVGVTEDKAVIDVCHETVTKEEDFSATPEIEEELTNEELKVTIEEVVPHVQENLPEPESVVEQEGVHPPEAVKEVVQGEVEAPEATEDNRETFRERQEEAPTGVSDVSAPEQVSKDLVPNQPEGSDTAIIEEKQDLEETKVEQERCTAGVVVEEVNLDQIIHEEAPMIQSPTVTHGDAGIATPHNTGTVSSTSNVIESPSSVSIEFKLNIRYGRASSQAPDVSEVGVQAVEEPLNQIRRDESEIQIKERAVQAAGITEHATASDSTERAVVTTPPVLMDIHIQALGDIKAPESGTSSVPAAETMQPVKQTENRGVSRRHPVISVASAQQVEEPVEAKEEEHEQDVWVDAQEDIREETEVPREEEEEFLEPCNGDEEEEEERHLETHKTVEVESDEDFAVAPESPDPEAVSVTTM
ncbi:A-kinase anchor protein 12-like [Pseudochaenichthys georgianus]|uniref:A-kinase anchor protein 12-like n=1 Tax=Pseudochaenichthys georgianus TaxID=52239 RepID=UPI00146B8846|nr:A-kinase anchor protein 12-like [Pseudochaenichthys georgianus]